MRFAPGTPPSVIKKAEKEWLYGDKRDKTAPVQPIMPPKPSPIHQRNYDRLTAMAAKGPLSQTNLRNLDYATKKVGRDMRILPMPTRGTLNNDMFTAPYPLVSPTSMPGPPPSPSPTQGAGAMGGGMPPAGPGAGAMGGGMPPAGNVQQTVSGGPPPNYGGMTMKKGGKVKNMASGGMTSKASPASKRGDGIAQRGKTKGRMV